MAIGDLNYYTKYRLEYSSKGNYSTKIDIKVRGYEGEVIELIGAKNPFNLTYEPSDNKVFSSFKSSYANLIVKETSELINDFKEIEDEDNYILEYYRDTNLYWTGYILQEQYQSNDDPNNPFISLKFYDAISRLRVYDINDTTLNSESYSYSLAQIFNNINYILYSNLGSLGFLGNDFLKVDETVIPEITPTPTPSATPTPTPTATPSGSGICYQIFIPDGYETNINGDLYIESQLTSTRNILYSTYESIYENGYTIVSLCSESYPVFRYGEFSESQSIPEITVSAGGACVLDSNCSYSPTPTPTPTPTITVTPTPTVTPVPSVSNIYEAVFIQRSTFFDNDGNTIDLYTVLENIASAFNFTYLIYVNQFTVTNFEFSENPKFIDFGNSNAVVQINHSTVLSNDLRFIEKSKLLTFWDSLKKIEVYHNFDSDPNYLVPSYFTEITKLREYVSEPDPIIENDSITFLTYADEEIARGGSPSRSYKDLYVSNSTPITITNDDFYGNKYRLKFNVKFEFDYGITDEEFDALSEPQKVQLEEYIKEVEKFTEIRIYYQVINNNGGNDYYLYISRSGNATYSSGYPYTIEVNSGVGADKLGIETLIEGYDYEVDIPVLSGTTSFDMSFFQPYVFTDVDLLDSSNSIRIEGVNMTISNIELVRTDKINLEELRYEGITDRNVFNYNLDRNREFKYLNIEEAGYKFNLLKSDNTVIGLGFLNRYLKDYSSDRGEALDVYSFLINQYLLQFGYQQQYITGNLANWNNTTFDIFTSIIIEGVKLGILKFSLNDKDSIYTIELMEIK